MGGTLFALVAYFSSTERLSQQLSKRSSIHGLHTGQYNREPL
jgi:hypothetical protein